MTKIKYEIDGQAIEIEVEDSVASAYVEIDAESRRNDWKHEKRAQRHYCSLERIENEGYQILGNDESPSEILERKEEFGELRAAIKQLLPQQQELIDRVYFKGQSHTEIAEELGVDRSAIGHRVGRALAALKKILQKN